MSLIRVQGYQERGYEHRYGTFLRADFPVGFLLLLAFCDPRHPNTVLPLYLAALMGCAGRCPSDKLGLRSLLSYALRAELSGLLTFF